MKYWRKKISRYNQKENQVSLIYNGLNTGKGKLYIQLSLNVLLEEDQIRFSSEIKNNEAHTIVRELQYFSW